MKKLSVTAGVCAVALTLSAGATLSGCSATKTKDAATPATSASSATPSTLAIPDLPSGPHKTVADYIAENKIIEAPVKKGDADAPTFTFPMPPDWRPAGNQKPEWAYGAIVYKKAADPADPPFVTAVVNKLTGNVEAAKVLEYAPGLLQNLPGYQQDGDIQKATFAGFDSIVFQGSYLNEDNKRRYIAQKTVVIPGKDGALFVLQLNADAPEGQGDVVREAAAVINRDSRITV